MEVYDLERSLWSEALLLLERIFKRGVGHLEVVTSLRGTDDF